MAEYSDFKRRHEQTVWHSLNRMMMALIAFAVIILILCAFVPELKHQREKNAELEVLRSEIARQRDLLAVRTREVDLLKNDREYVEMVARDSLQVMKEGETIFRIDSAKPPTPDRSNYHRNN